MVREVGVVGHPVAQRRKGLWFSVVKRLAENRLMTMAEDHGIVSFLKFPKGKPVHDFRQTVLGHPGNSLAHLRTETGQPPEQLQRKQPQKCTGKAASQESPERQIFPVAPV